MRAIFLFVLATLLSLAIPPQRAELAPQPAEAARLARPAEAARQHRRPLGPARALPALAKPAGVDLDVTYISRAPLYSRYDVQYTPAGTPFLQPGSEQAKRWPAFGEQVTFTAHFANKGTVSSGSFAFRWLVDGNQVASGTHASLAPGQAATATYQWAWAHQSDGDRLLGAHTVRFEADPAGAIAETYETNNSVEDRTDAIGLVLAVTPALYAALETPVDAKWPFSAEDWLQKQIAAMNAAFARSIYPSTPSGVTERVRLENILVTSTEPPTDLAIDGSFYMRDDDRAAPGYYDPDTDVSGGLIHELSHQLGMIDLYNFGFDLDTPALADRNDQPVQMETGLPATGLMLNPGIRPLIYEEHTARALNANKGYRRGYYGEYLYDVPAQTNLRVLDSQGAPAAGVTLRLYQPAPASGLTSWKIDGTPELSAVTDGNGMAQLPNRPVGAALTTRTNHTLRDNPFGVIDVVGERDEFILELTKGSHQEYAWLNITQVNLAAWQSGGSSATIQIASHVPPAAAPAAPGWLSSLQGKGQVMLSWLASASPGEAGYNVYRATGKPQYAYQRVAQNIAALSYAEPYDQDSRFATYAVTAVDAQGRESGFSNLINAFRLANPAGVAVDELGRRIVLDPQNGYALFAQLPDGRFVDAIGSQHYHLERSSFIARDAAGRLILSHPGDDYGPRHSVRVADKDGEPLFEFGEQGSAVGQFQSPAGVAVWGKPCDVSTPYSPDAHTLLLLHFDGGYAGAQGEPGAPAGTTFTPGKYAQGVQIDSNDALTYATQGNLNRTQGAIEFWLRPDWNGDDGQQYTFFEVGSQWYNRMRIMKDGANNLRFMLWDSASEYGVGANIGGWRAGEWHHVAATWQGSSIALYVDGEKLDASETAHPADTLAATINIGSSLWNDQQANATIDELRVSDIARVRNSDSCAYRILVADSGNNRLEAFDGQGQFVSAYGQGGAGPGQFDNPQGLAVNAAGQVIVADSGNQRLQVLDFDGASFGYVRSVKGFAQPIGVAAYGADRIVVADTGAGRVDVLDAAGQLLATYVTSNDGQAGAFSQPRGVAVDQVGSIVVADTGNARVVTIGGALGHSIHMPLIRR